MKTAGPLSAYIAKLAKEEFRFEGVDAPQPTRVRKRARVGSTSTFSASHSQFVVKGPMQVPRDKVADLNDFMFSAALFPETGVQWELVHAVICHLAEDYECPICLSTPICPVMTRCGHVFCLDCIETVFSIFSPAPCPVCSEILVRSEIVRARIVYHGGSPVYRFRKICRDKMNCVCGPEVPATMPTASEGNSFSIVKVCDTEFDRKLHADELEQLTMAEVMYSDDETKLEAIRKAKRTIEAIEPAEDNPPFRLGGSGAKVMFFQEETGRFLFMSPINVAILQEQYKSFDKIPEYIEGAWIKQDTVSMENIDVNLYPQFYHLPADAEPTVALIDISAYVSPKLMRKYRKYFRVKAQPKQRKRREHIGIEDFQNFDDVEVPIEEPSTEIGADDMNHWEDIMDSHAFFPSFDDV